MTPGEAHEILQGMYPRDREVPLVAAAGLAHWVSGFQRIDPPFGWTAPSDQPMMRRQYADNDAIMMAGAIFVMIAEGEFEKAGFSADPEAAGL